MSLSKRELEYCLAGALQERKCSFLALDASRNTILEYVYRLDEEERGEIYSFLFSDTIEIDEDSRYRVALFETHKGFFYVFAKTESELRGKWRVVARTGLLKKMLERPDLSGVCVTHVSFG